MTLIEKLQELGFKKIKNNGTYIQVLDVRGVKDRFSFTIIYDIDKNEFYIMAHKSSSKLITEDDILRNHNNTNPQMKEKWIELKEQLKEFDIVMGDIYN